MEKYLDITDPRYSEQILPVPWHFVIWTFHCTVSNKITCLEILRGTTLVRISVAHFARF